MNVLLIEDNEPLAQSFSRMLRRQGHAVTHVPGIGAALEHVADRKEKFDLVLTDRDVVGGNAWDFVREAISLGQLPDNVIFMSGSPPEETLQPFFHKGQDDYAKLVALIEKAAKAA